MLNKLNARLEKLRANEANESGFTLIELLIVIVILGILAAVVVFSVQGITNKGQDAACKSDLTTLQTALESYYANTTGTGSYPAVANLETALVPKYIHSIPANFTYALSGGQYTLTGTGTCNGVNG